MKTISKVYSSKSTAQRAAKAAVAANPEATISAPYTAPGGDGWLFDIVTKPAAKKAVKAVAKADKSDPAKKAATKTAVVERSYGAGLTKAQQAELRKLEEQAIERGDITSKPTGYEQGTDNFPTLIVRKSVVKNPVLAAWELFDVLRAKSDKSGEKLRRKDAIAAAVQSGIAFYTARTQYQSWKTANKF